MRMASCRTRRVRAVSATKAPAPVGGGRPGEDAVYRYGRAGERLGQAAGNRELRDLGHAVVDHLGRDLERGFTGDEDDPPPVACPHAAHVVART